MWRMGSTPNRRGYNPFGSVYGNPYAVPAGPSRGSSYGNPYAGIQRNAYNNERKNAKSAPGWPGFAMNEQQRNGANVASMKGFGKKKSASEDVASDIEDQAGIKDEGPKSQTESAAQEKGATVSPEGVDEKASAGSAAAEDAKSAAESIIEEAEAVVENAVNAAGEELDDALAAAQQEAADWQDRYMRLHAEWDTYRRRMTEQRAEEKTRATEKLIEDLLPVLDDFERTVDYANENGEAGLLDGVKAVQTKLVDALVKDGLVVIDPAGEAYNALEAQAVATVPDSDVYDETVKDVYQKGYKLGNKVIRPAMVTVTTGGPARPKDETNDGSDAAEQAEAADE